MKFYMVVFSYYSNSHSTKKNLTLCIPLLGVLCNISGPIFGILLIVLRKLKHSLDILHEYCQIAVITKVRNVLGFPPALDIFWYFWSILYIAPQIVGNHVAFSFEFLLTFLNPHPTGIL